MARSRWIVIVLSCFVIGVALILGYFHEEGSIASATANPTLTSITPDQLKAIGVSLTAPPNDAPKISAAQAEATVADRYPGKIIETVHATCAFTVGAMSDADCWIVVPDPTVDGIRLLGSTDGPARYAGVEYEVGIVDAGTGDFLLGARQGSPPPN